MKFRHPDPRRSPSHLGLPLCLRSGWAPMFTGGQAPQAGQAPPSPVRAGSVSQRSRTGISGHQRFGGTTGYRPSGSSSRDDVRGRFGLWSRRSRVAASGSRRATTGVRNDRGVRPKTVKDHERRFRHRRPLTWCFPRAVTVLNTMQFLTRRSRADLARKKSPVPGSDTIPIVQRTIRTATEATDNSGAGAVRRRLG
jgi:hypothetical protein